MFARLPDLPGAEVSVTIDGVPFRARSGDTVAATLLLAGHAALRATLVSGALRGPFCLMGACFECVVTIDDRANVQSCMVLVAPGMRIVTQHATTASPSPGAPG